MPADSTPVVSWAGPVEQASQHLRKATDHLEAKRFADGVQHLREAKIQIDIAMRFIEALPKP